jgi:hypothetical protein
MYIYIYKLGSPKYRYIYIFGIKKIFTIDKYIYLYLYIYIYIHIDIDKRTQFYPWANDL